MKQKYILIRFREKIDYFVIFLCRTRHVSVGHGCPHHNACHRVWAISVAKSNKIMSKYQGAAVYMLTSILRKFRGSSTYTFLVTRDTSRKMQNFV